MPLYEYAIILEEKVKDDEVAEKEQLLTRGELMAPDQEKAQLMAAREIPEEHLEHLERVTLALRPF